MEKGLIRVSVIAFCHDGNGKYVISKRSQNCRDEQGKWEPVAGGGVKFNERIEDAAVREIREESGASIKNLEFLGYRDVFRVQDGVDTHWIAFDFKARVDPKEVHITEPHKCDEQRWVAIDELAHMEDLHSQFPAFIKKYRAVLQ